MEVKACVSHVNYKNLEGAALIPTGNSKNYTEVVISVQITRRNKML